LVLEAQVGMSMTIYMRVPSWAEYLAVVEGPSPGGDGGSVTRS
jgi:hypothetical protein